MPKSTKTYDHTYRLRYRMQKPEAGEFHKKDFGPNDGGTDALIIGSMLYPADGSYSQNFWSFDGRNDAKELSSGELFKFWLCMGKTLSDRGDLDLVRKEIAKTPADMFFELINKAENSHGHA